MSVHYAGKETLVASQIRLVAQDRRHSITFLITFGRGAESRLARQAGLHLISSKHIFDVARVGHRSHSIGIQFVELFDKSHDLFELPRHGVELAGVETKPR